VRHAGMGGEEEDEGVLCSGRVSQTEKEDDGINM
jgi:hypothetical protein